MAKEAKESGNGSGAKSPSCPFSVFRYGVGQELRLKILDGSRLVVLEQVLSTDGTGMRRRYVVRTHLGTAITVGEAEVEPLAVCGMDGGDVKHDPRVIMSQPLTANEVRGLTERHGLNGEAAGNGDGAKVAARSGSSRNGAAKRKALRERRANPKPTVAPSVAA